ncbi:MULTISPECIES: SUKH-4 family immunity protein [Streptacidiphilus]|uniref:SUKH-4 family immunity protein n=1 Tax=Streptacidiphilus cavernicola TaxID=3342716 RepID=A0ABV6UHM2_9ACTN|nr:SUKH-4 family immunity protein [Streptacidiphilus jeojiense]
MPQTVDRALMESVFPADDLVTVPEGALAPVSHARTRELLRDVGLPDQPTGWFQTVKDLSVEIADKGWPRGRALHPSSDLVFDEWIAIGGIPYDTMVVDAGSGAVYCIPGSGAEPYLLNSSLDDFLYFLYSVEAERPNYDAEFAEENGFEDDGEFGVGVDERLLAVMREADPVALQNPGSTWFTVLEYVRTFGE